MEIWKGVRRGGMLKICEIYNLGETWTACFD